MNQDKYFDFIINGIQLGKFQQQFSVNDMTDFHRFKLGTACSIQNFNMSIIRNCEHEQLFDDEIENIDVYKNKKDEVSFKQNGNNNEERFFEYIKGDASPDFYINISIKEIQYDNLTALFEFLKDKINIEINFTNIPSGISYKLKYENEVITFNYYATKVLVIQSKYSLLIGLVQEYLESINHFELTLFINSELKRFSKGDDLRTILPKSYNKLEDELKSLLFNSFTLTNINLGLEDNTYSIFSSLRALEGYLWQSAKKHNINPHNGYGLFFFLNGKIQQNYVNFFPNCINEIEMCYNYYTQNRNRLFHIDKIRSSATAKIESLEEAKNTFNNIIYLIESTCDKLI